jgi:4-hydroxy-tetrahydrodipicolinate synthase
MKSLRGTGVALVTPFDHHLEVDYAGLENLLKHTAENGADYFVVMGTTAEAATLSAKEKKEVLNFIKSNNPNKLPIVYGLGGNNTQALIRDIDELDVSGIDAFLSVSPYYNKPTQEGIVTHFTLLANHAPIPVILYNIPGRTASNMAAETTLVLADHPNICGVKESSGNLEQIIHIAAEKPEDFMLISGDDLWSMTLYALGGDGVISVMANAFPDVFREMKNAADTNDFAHGRAQTFRLRMMHDLMYQESNPVGLKQLLFELGICEKHVRLPLLPASDHLAEKIRNTMQVFS